MKPDLHLGHDVSRLIEAVDPRRDAPIAVAVSGGSDSTALLYRAHAWSTKSGRPLLVLTVDHRLRPEARAEAEQVCSTANTMGHRAQCLVWTDPRPGQSAARRARHMLLANAAREQGARTILMGHTLDDVLETAMLRRKRGVRSARLAGPVPVSVSPVWPAGRGISVLRPLLYQTRQELRGLLTETGIAWVEDPSNESPVYERARIRSWMARHPQLKFRGLDLARSALDDRIQFEARLGESLLDVSIVGVDEDGLIRVSLEDIGEAMRVPAMQSLLRIAGGHSEPVRAGRLAVALESLSRPGARTTLAGAWLQRTARGVLIGRDPGAESSGWSDGLWDGRYAEAPSGQPDRTKAQFLVRQSLPASPPLREVISERIRFEARLMTLNCELSEGPLVRT